MECTGIVSCYFKQNYGSMLQAYATHAILDKLCIDNETINIDGISKRIKLAKLCYFAKASLTSDIFIQKAGMAKNVLRKKLSKGTYKELTLKRAEKFTEFMNDSFRVSERCGSKSELTEKCRTKYSAVLIGSDQLWLPANIAADYYTLSFVHEDVNSIAYATSFGMKELPKDSEKKAKIFLNRIKHISVREKSGQDIVYKITGRKVPVVCDPTMLFDDDEWLKVQQKEPILKGKYILCYFLGRNSYARQFAAELKKETGCRIVSLAHLDEFVRADEVFSDEIPLSIGPAEFLNLLRYAEYVCTDSFHCSVFSILYRKTFFAFRRYTKNTKQSTNNRLDNLFERIGLNGRIQEGDETVKEVLRKTIDYAGVHKRLDEFRNESLDYLRKSLADNGSTDL